MLITSLLFQSQQTLHSAESSLHFQIKADGTNLEQGVVLLAGLLLLA